MPSPHGRRAFRPDPLTFGRYELHSLLGVGASSAVYLANDPATRQPVAVKVLSGWAADPLLRQRIRAEAELMRRVDDPHCVRVVDIVEQPPDVGVVMAYIESATLREVLDGAGPLTGPQALHVLRGALLGLVAVHGAGLVHGDVKPANIVVDRRGNAMLIDFGLTRAAGSKSSRPEGSPAYMSPEQGSGSSTDARSDVYAAGAVLFELLTGRRPYPGDSVDAVVRSHRSDPVPDPRMVEPDLSDGLAAVCMRAMAKLPADRFQSAQAFLDALEDAARDRYGAAWFTGAGLGAAAGTALATRAAASAAPRRRRGRAARAVTVGAALIAALLFGLLRSGADHPKAAARPPALSAPARPSISAHGSGPASAYTACTARDLGRLLPAPRAGEVLRSVDVFDTNGFIAAYSLHPRLDRSGLTAAGLRCGLREFVQNSVSGETTYLYQLRDAASAVRLQRFFRSEPKSPGSIDFPVPSVPGANGGAQSETVGNAPPFYEYDVVFTCGHFLVQVGYGFNTKVPTGAAQASSLAAATRAGLSC